MRRDIELYLVLQGEPDAPKTMRLRGDELKYLNPDERSTGALVRNALMKKNDTADNAEIRSTPGIYISRDGFKDILEKLSKISTLVYLKEDGGSFDSINPSKDLTFILSDDKNMSEEEEAEISKFHPETISLGPIIYHSDHCITIVLWNLDNKIM